MTDSSSSSSSSKSRRRAEKKDADIVAQAKADFLAQAPQLSVRVKAGRLESPAVQLTAEQVEALVQVLNLKQVGALDQFLAKNAEAGSSGPVMK